MTNGGSLYQLTGERLSLLCHGTLASLPLISSPFFICTRARAVSEKEWLPAGSNCLSSSSWFKGVRRDPTVHFSVVSLASHFTPQGEVDLTSSLRRKIDPGTSKAKKEDLDDEVEKKVNMDSGLWYSNIARIDKVGDLQRPVSFRPIQVSAGTRVGQPNEMWLLQRKRKRGPSYFFPAWIRKSKNEVSVED